VKTTRLLLLFLAFSLLIQNTCPYGFAAKTGFIAKENHHCHCKKYPSSKPEADDSAKKVISQTGQIFVFIVGDSINPAPLSFPEISCSLQEMNLYKNISSEPAVKPPIFV